MAWPGRLWARLTANPLLQRVLRNSGYLLSASTLSTALSMLQGALAARMVGVEGLGLVGVITDFGSNVNRLTSFRMSQLVVHYVGEFTERGKPREAAAVFKVAGLVEIGSSLVAVALIAAFSPLAATFLGHDPATAPLFLVYGLAILANLMMESSTGLLQLADRFAALSWITLGQSLITLGLMAVAFVRGEGLLAVVVAYTVGKAIGAVAISLMALVEAGRRWGAGWWRAPMRLLWDRRMEMIRFAWSTNLSTTIALLTRDSELLWLSAFSSPTQVGLYKVAKAITNVLFVPVNPLISTTYREVSLEISARRWPNVRYLLRSGSILASLWTLPAALGLIIAGRGFISLVYTPDFVGAYVPLLILLAGTVIVNILYWNRSVLLLLGQAAYPNWVHLWAGVLKIVGTVVLVPMAGANAMAALLSAYFAGTTGVLVARTDGALRRAETALSAATGA
ncbi:MAG TPA: oligosaccharide flippase family protein [Anaerolineales bacterium]|nr:oligosaccharide flippase family protein [Anaerolineales bacterium]